MKKKRLDTICAEKGFSQSRERAKREILAGWVRVNGETVRDPSRNFTGEEDIAISRPGGDFVSRGGYKLQRAMENFKPEVQGLVVADLGASTGGFTHCLLLNGAKRVYAVDVGYGQLDYSLRNDPRVTVMERTNARQLTRESFNDHIDFLTLDLSFVSLLKVFPVILDLFRNVPGIALVKPQFEAESSEHKKGVVRRADTHRKILGRVMVSLVEMGVSVLGLTWSPLKGPKGNIEFLLYFHTSKGMGNFSEEEQILALVEATVEHAHAFFDDNSHDNPA